MHLDILDHPFTAIREKMTVNMILLDTLVAIILAIDSACLFSPIVYTIYKTKALTYQNHG